MDDLESRQPAFPHVRFATVHAGLHSKKKQLHLRNQELGNGLQEGGVNAGPAESEWVGRKWK